MELDFNELRELVTLLNQTDVAEFILKSNEFELTLRKGGVLGSDRPSTVATLPDPVESAPLPRPVPTPAPAPPLPPPAIPVAVSPPPPPRANERLVEITSPMVGTFYRASGPDEPPFVNVGDRIRPGQTVCIIEAMKLMNELEAEASGEIVEILVQNSEPVEFGQVLMRVNPG